MAHPDSKLNKAQKFVRFLELLLQPEGVRVVDVMERFGVDDRTLRRYVSDLRSMDVPVLSSGRGFQRHLRVDARYQRRGLQLSLLELVSLRFGRQLFDFLEGTGFAEDMDEALETLSTIAIGKDNALAENLERKFMSVQEHRKDHTRHADLIDDVLSALLYQNPAVAHYAKLAGPTKSYQLHPYTLVTFKHGLYLFARDLKDDRVKTFAIDRFRNFERQRGAKFEYPADYQPKSVVAHSFGIIGGTPELVVLRFNRRSAPYVRERVWHESQVLSEADGGGLRLSMRVAVSPELVSWVMGFGPDVAVDAPDTLAERVRRRHHAAAQGFDAMPRRGG